MAAAGLRRGLFPPRVRREALAAREILGVLTAIGLDEAEERAYRLLVALGTADLEDLARRLAVGSRETGRLLHALEQHGLVAQSSSEPGRHWIAAPPGVALRALLIQQRHELDQAELLAAELAEEYRTKADESDSNELVEVVVGAAAVTHRFLQLQHGAEVEVCSLVTDKPVAVSGSENEAEEAAIERGVAYRVVIERGVLSSPTDFAEVSAALGREVKVRVVDRVPTKLVVADGAVAMVPLNVPGSEPAAMVIHASGLLDSLAALFEAVWREATAAGPERPCGRSRRRGALRPRHGRISRSFHCCLPASPTPASPSSWTWAPGRSSGGSRA